MLLKDAKMSDEGVADSASPDAPPPYDAPPPSSSSSSLPSPRKTRPRPSNVLATNHVTITRQDSSIKGTYVIDPGLQHPEEILSESGATANSAKDWFEEDAADGLGKRDSSGGGERRKNLYLASKNCSVTADVWLVDDVAASTGFGDEGRERERERERERAELDVRSKNGSVNVKLESLTTHPFALTAYSKNASVSVAIPSDFVGPVTLHTSYGSVSLSEGVKSALTTFSEREGTRNCFIGDITKEGYTGRQSWKGSTVDATSYHCRVRLSFVDEEAKGGVSGFGFIRRIFGA